MKKQEKDRIVVELIEAVWDSLVSHLEDCHKHVKVPQTMKERYGNKRFHKRCVKEYAQQIEKLTRLL